MNLSGNDKLWTIVNAADNLVSMLVDTSLYELYAEEVTGSYENNGIKTISGFEKAVTRFTEDHETDYQIEDVYEIAMNVIDMVDRF